MAEQIKFGDRLFLKGEKVLFDNGINDAIIESRNGTLVIKGNLTVEGTTTSVNTESTTIADPHMLLTGLSVGTTAGIEVERTLDVNVKFSWDEVLGSWTVGAEDLHANMFIGEFIGDVIGDIVSTGLSTFAEVDINGGNIDGTVIGASTPLQAYFTNIYGDGTNITNVLTNYTTDDLAEGSSNLYFTDERVDDRISNLFDASYGITATYTDPANTFEISLDAINIGTGEQVLDTSDTVQAAFRTLKSGPNLDLTVSTDGDNIVVDTTVKINNLAFNTFTGTGSVSIYTLPYAVSQDWQVLVYIDGVVQEPTNSYNVVGNTLTLSAPLALSSVMNVIKMASNTIASTVIDADSLNTFAGSYYLDYANFTNTPTIPTVPTNVSAFTNDSGYITNADIPTNHMVNDANNTVAGTIAPTQDATYDLGTATEQWNTIYGHTVEATYADLAERYASDAPYEPGTVLVFGGEAEVTTTTMLADTKVVGIVSTDPALKMNSAAGNDVTHPYIALKGRVPCKVIGKIEKGDLLVTSDNPGYAKKSLGVPMIGTVIGKAIGSNETGEGIIEVFVSMM
ncbi:hypothetical protein N9R43_01965 [bacterium]|nr:hypothetical protein [bacterium]